MQLQRIELKNLGITERSLRSDAQSNFDKLANAVNSNAGTTETWYKQLSSNLVAEDGKIKQSEDRLGKRITASEDRLSERIAALEQIIFGQNPQEVNMADNSTPPLANGGAMIINLTSKEDK